MRSCVSPKSWFCIKSKWAVRLFSGTSLKTQHFLVLGFKIKGIGENGWPYTAGSDCSVYASTIRKSTGKSITNSQWLSETEQLKNVKVSHCQSSDFIWECQKSNVIIMVNRRPKVKCSLEQVYSLCPYGLVASEGKEYNKAREICFPQVY